MLPPLCYWEQCRGEYGFAGMSLRPHFQFFRIYTRSGIDGSHDHSIFSVLRRLHAVFHSSFTSLHFHRQCAEVPFSLHPSLHLLNPVLFENGHPNGCEEISHSVLIFISLMVRDVAHNFICLLSICVSA